MNTVYSKRVICFLDILGFRDIVLKGNAGFNSESILKVLSLLSETKEDNDSGAISLKDIGREVSVFSDSIVISYPTELGSSLFYIIMDIIHLQIELLNKNILVRAGISIGDLYHEDKIVFGPALIEVYDLEVKKAVYPRIMITLDTLMEGLKIEFEKYGYSEYNLKLLLEILIEEEENYFYIDYLSQWEELDEIYDYLVLIKKVEVLIENELKSSDPRVKSKYEWLDKYLDFVKEKVQTEM